MKTLNVLMASIILLTVGFSAAAEPSDGRFHCGNHIVQVSGLMIVPSTVYYPGQMAYRATIKNTYIATRLSQTADHEATSTAKADSFYVEPDEDLQAGGWLAFFPNGGVGLFDKVTHVTLACKRIQKQ